MAIEDILMSLNSVEKKELEELEENITPAVHAAGSGFGCTCSG